MDNELGKALYDLIQLLLEIELDDEDMPIDLKQPESDSIKDNINK